jgi:hypothetical protein
VRSRVFRADRTEDVTMQRALRRRAAIPLLAALASLPAAPARAALDEWGTFADGDTRFCEAGVCDGTSIQVAEDGGLFDSFASVAFVPDDPLDTPGNDFAAEAALLGGLGLPELRVLAVAPVVPSLAPVAPGRFISTASAEAVAGFLYTGLLPKELVLDVVVDGTVTGFGSLSGFISVYEEEGFDRLGEFHGTRLASTVFIRELDETRDPEPLVFEAEPGDAFYVWAAAFASADSREATPSSADAFHTLSMSFEDPSGLEAATIPEPANGSLLVLGCALFTGRARRRG